MSFPKYAEYAGTEAEWIPRIPAHWAFLPAKALFKDRNARALNSEQQLTASQKYGVIPQALFAELEQVRVMQVVTGRDILKQARKGDFVISMRSFQGGLEYCLYDGAVSSAYVPIYKVNSEVEHGYFKFLFKEATFIKALQQTSNLVRDGQALRFSNLTQVRLPLPSPGEQTQIARFLDHETAKIDALIAEQKRLIKLLQEKRQAVISHAVTKGLDPNVPMKDSGVEWLGKVPAHWGLFSLKRSVEGCVNGIWGNEPDGENDIAVIRVADFDRDSLSVRLDKLTFRSVTDKERLPRLIKKGDLLIEKSGGGEKTLVGCVVRYEHGFEAVTSNFVARMRPLNGFNGAFLCYCFDSLYQGKANYSSIKQTTGIQNLDSEAYLQEYFCFPTPAEQTQIARFLDHETAKLDELGNQALKSIELMKERRSALISAAVTGKIDVRDWQPPADESAVDEDVQKAGLEASA